MSERKTTESQLKASEKYASKALEKVAPLIISHTEQDVFDALQSLKEHYKGNRAKAIKQAILAHAHALNLS